MSRRRKKIPDHAPPPPLTSLPPLHQVLAKTEGLGSLPIIEFACKLESHVDVYRQLEIEGYFLPQQRCFSLEWCRAWLREEKDFLKIEQLAPVKPILLPEFNWDLLKELMYHKDLIRFFYWDDKVVPDFDYIYKVTATKFPNWHQQILNSSKEKGAEIFIGKKRMEWLKSLPSKEPNGKGYRKLGIKALIKRPSAMEIENFCDDLKKSKKFQEKDIDSYKTKLICDEQQEKSSNWLWAKS